MVETWVQRGALEDAFDASVAAPRTLREQLRIYETSARASLTAVASGIESTSANGHMTKLAQVSDDQRQLVGMSAESWRLLIDLHDEVKGYLGGAASDAAVKTEMLLLLVPVTEIGPSCLAGLRS